MNERLEPYEEIKLSIAAGVVEVVELSSAADDVRRLADAEQYRAKNETRKTTPRPSVIALQGQDDLKAVFPTA